MQKIYKTRPITMWKHAKELRNQVYKEIANARDNGKLIVSGCTGGFLSLPAGLGDYVFLGGEPYAASVSLDPELSQLCWEAVEAKGFSRDLCSYIRNYWGSMFLNRFSFGGEFPKPNFCLTFHTCDSHAKWYQVVTEYYSIPYFGIELPLGADPDRLSLKQEYLVNELNSAIEWMEKITGKKYDDEKLIEAVKNEYNSVTLWGNICLLNKAIPAPLDMKTMLSLYIICVLIRHRKEAVEFYKNLNAEVEDRVANGIAALATERCRILDDSQPIWSFLDLYRYMENFGAITVGSLYLFSLAGNYEERADGTWVSKKTLEERGMVPRTREQALNVLAELYLDRPINKAEFAPHLKSSAMEMLVREYNCQGVTIHLNRGCELTSLGVMENRLALVKKGIPVMTYEGNMGDRREVNQQEILNRLEAFMETLGLTKLS